jgi:hypothetical protein
LPAASNQANKPKKGAAGIGYRDLTDGAMAHGKRAQGNQNYGSNTPSNV